MGKKKNKEHARVSKRYSRVIDALNKEFKGARSDLRASKQNGAIYISGGGVNKMVELLSVGLLPEMDEEINIDPIFDRMLTGAWKVKEPNAARDCYKPRYFPKGHWGPYSARIKDGVLIVGDQVTEFRHPLKPLGKSSVERRELPPHLHEVKDRVDQLLKDNKGLNVEGGLTEHAVFSRKMQSPDGKSWLVKVECKGLLTEEMAAQIVPALEAEHKSMLQRAYEKVNAGLKAGAERWGELIIRDMITVLRRYDGVSETSLTAILRGTALPSKVFKHAPIKHKYLSPDQIKHMIHTLSRSGAITYRTVHGEWTSYAAYTFHIKQEFLDYESPDGDIAFSTQVLNLIQRGNLQLGDYMALVEALHRPAVMAGYGEKILPAFDAAPETLLPMLKIKLDLSQDKTVTKHIKAAISRVKKKK